MRWAIGALAVVMVGCTGGGGGSDDPIGDAEAHCAEQQEGQEACFGDAQLDECVDCHIECGGPCAVLESCPVQFSCEK